MGRVLVDEDEPVGPLGQDIGLIQSAQDGEVLKAKAPGAGVGEGARGQRAPGEGHRRRPPRRRGGTPGKELARLAFRRPGGASGCQVTRYRGLSP